MARPVTRRDALARAGFMANDIADVLIVGAGASGAAVAWSLAETRMRILQMLEEQTSDATDANRG